MKQREENHITCRVCPHHCSLAEGQYGRCRARKNENGTIISTSYGKLTALMLDPIEKKPLRRFHPGSQILSVGSFGCNLSCPFCQNHEISMRSEPETGCRPMSPEELADLAEQCKMYGNIGVAFTYNEPLIGYEYVRDTARLVHARGMKNVLVTNGTAELSVLDEILPYIDAMNIDLKGFQRRLLSRNWAATSPTVKHFHRPGSLPRRQLPCGTDHPHCTRRERFRRRDGTGSAVDCRYQSRYPPPCDPLLSAIQDDRQSSDGCGENISA